MLKYDITDLILEFKTIYYRIKILLGPVFKIIDVLPKYVFDLTNIETINKLKHLIMTFSCFDQSKTCFIKTKHKII